MSGCWFGSVLYESLKDCRIIASIHFADEFSFQCLVFTIYEFCSLIDHNIVDIYLYR